MIRVMTMVRFRAKSQASNLSVIVLAQKEEARIMYNISRSETGGVLLKRKLCSHTERVDEFDDRYRRRRTQAAQAMLNHTRADHGGEPVGRPMSKALESWV
jgi:hypothetical protein